MHRLFFLFPCLILIYFITVIIYVQDTQADENTGVPTTQTTFVTQAVFARDVQERKPIDVFTTMTETVDHVFFYTDLRNLVGRTVRHRWIHNNVVYNEVAFDVRAVRWRVWSSKRMQVDLFGLWEVRVVDEEGRQLARKVMHYLP